MKTKILKKERIGSDKFILTITKPKELDYYPGQFVFIKDTIEGKTIKRPYTLASHPTEPRLMFYIKQLPDGKMSNNLAQKKEGEILEVSKPMGVNNSATFRDLPNIVYLTAGCGVAGVRSLALEFKGKKRQIIVHQEAKKELLVWKGLFKKVGEYYPVLSRERSKESLFGHIQDYIKRWLIENSIYYIVGPVLFIREVSKLVKAANLKKIEIHVEGFG